MLRGFLHGLSPAESAARWPLGRYATPGPDRSGRDRRCCRDFVCTAKATGRNHHKPVPVQRFPTDDRPTEQCND